jgi:chromate transporter
LKSYLNLFLTFTKIGLSTFGGGYAMVPVLERELIDKRGWLTMDEVMDYYTIAQVTPGIIAVNISTFVGYKRKGIAGGILATMGFILPGVLLMTVISLFISRFAEYPAVRHVFAGIRIAVGALILDTVRKLVAGIFAGRSRCRHRQAGKAGGAGEAAQGTFSKPRKILMAGIFAAAFLLSALLSLSPVWIVAGAALAGFLFFRPAEPRNNPGDRP